MLTLNRKRKTYRPKKSEKGGEQGDRAAKRRALWCARALAGGEDVQISRGEGPDNQLSFRGYYDEVAITKKVLGRKKGAEGEKTL